MDAAREPAPGEAVVVPGFARGAALLRAEDQSCIRLSWEDEPPGADRRRVLPAGRYALIGYRLIARDARQRTWHVSAGGVQKTSIELASGGTTTLEIDATIQMAERFRADGLQLAVQGVGRSGLSIYKEGKRIPIRYLRQDAAGKTLAEGPVEYG